MKRILLAIAVAMPLMFAACGGSTTQGGTTKTAAPEFKEGMPLEADPAVVKELTNTIDRQNYTVSLPAFINDDYTKQVLGEFDDPNSLYIGDGDVVKPVNLEIDYNEFGDQGIKRLAEGDSILMSNTERKAEPTIYRANAYATKARFLGTVEWHFCIIKDNHHVFGKYTYYEENADKHDKYFAAIMNSIKIK